MLESVPTLKRVLTPFFLGKRLPDEDSDEKSRQSV